MKNIKKDTFILGDYNKNMNINQIKLIDDFALLFQTFLFSVRLRDRAVQNSVVMFL